MQSELRTMLNKLSKNIGVIILFLLAIFCSFHFGRYAKMSTYRNETTYNTDTLYLEKLELENPSLWWRLGHKRINPAWERPVKYEEWMGTSQNAVRIIVDSGNDIRIISLRDKNVKEQSFPYGESFTWQDGVLFSNRFSNPFHWTGILISGQYSFIPEQVFSPSVETGIIVKRITLLGGMKITPQVTPQVKYQIQYYVKGTIRLW